MVGVGRIPHYGIKITPAVCCASGGVNASLPGDENAYLDKGQNAPREGKY